MGSHHGPPPLRLALPDVLESGWRSPVIGRRVADHRRSLVIRVPRGRGLNGRDGRRQLDWPAQLARPPLRTMATCVRVAPFAVGRMLKPLGCRILIRRRSSPCVHGSVDRRSRRIGVHRSSLDSTSPANAAGRGAVEPHHPRPDPGRDPGRLVGVRYRGRRIPRARLRHHRRSERSGRDFSHGSPGRTSSQLLEEVTPRFRKVRVPTFAPARGRLPIEPSGISIRRSARSQGSRVLSG